MNWVTAVKKAMDDQVRHGMLQKGTDLQTFCCTVIFVLVIDFS